MICSMLHSCHPILKGAWPVVHVFCMKIHLCVMRVVVLVCYAVMTDAWSGVQSWCL